MSITVPRERENDCWPNQALATPKSMCIDTLQPLVEGLDQVIDTSQPQDDAKGLVH